MKKKKRLTIRFYTASDRYTGWRFLDETDYFYIKNWLKHSDYILCGDQRFDNKSTNNEIFALIRRGKK